VGGVALRRHPHLPQFHLQRRPIQLNHWRSDHPLRAWSGLETSEAKKYIYFACSIAGPHLTRKAEEKTKSTRQPTPNSPTNQHHLSRFLLVEGYLGPSTQILALPELPRIILGSRSRPPQLQQQNPLHFHAAFPTWPSSKQSNVTSLE
jgi:hypothetical protein